jgi:hypothetical protein
MANNEDLQNHPGDQARRGTEAHSNSNSADQDRRTVEPQAAQGQYDRFQGRQMDGNDREQSVGYGQPAEYDDRYAQSGKPQSQPAILGEKDLQPMHPNAATSGASGEHARWPERNR